MPLELLLQIFKAFVVTTVATSGGTWRDDFNLTPPSFVCHAWFVAAQRITSSALRIQDSFHLDQVLTVVHRDGEFSKSIKLLKINVVNLEEADWENIFSLASRLPHLHYLEIQCYFQPSLDLDELRRIFLPHPLLELVHLCIMHDEVPRQLYRTPRSNHLIQIVVGLAPNLRQITLKDRCPSRGSDRTCAESNAFPFATFVRSGSTPSRKTISIQGLESTQSMRGSLFYDVYRGLEEFSIDISAPNPLARPSAAGVWTAAGQTLRTLEIFEVDSSPAFEDLSSIFPNLVVLETLVICTSSGLAFGPEDALLLMPLTVRHLGLTLSTSSAKMLEYPLPNFNATSLALFGSSVSSLVILSSPVSTLSVYNEHHSFDSIARLPPSIAELHLSGNTSAPQDLERIAVSNRAKQRLKDLEVVVWLDRCVKILPDFTRKRWIATARRQNVKLRFWSGSEA